MNFHISQNFAHSNVCLGEGEGEKKSVFKMAHFFSPHVCIFLSFTNTFLIKTKQMDFIVKVCHHCVPV